MSNDVETPNAAYRNLQKKYDVLQERFDQRTKLLRRIIRGQNQVEFWAAVDEARKLLSLEN